MVWFGVNHATTHATTRRVVRNLRRELDARPEEVAHGRVRVLLEVSADQALDAVVEVRIPLDDREVEPESTDQLQSKWSPTSRARRTIAATSL